MMNQRDIMSKCLICTRETGDTGEYHTKCARRLFESPHVPEIPYDLEELNQLASQVVRQRVTIPGVQAKMSMEVQKQAGRHPKITITGLWGRYILKPPSQQWDQLPENEHTTLSLADAAGIQTVPFGLVRLRSGELSFLTRRIDRRSTGQKMAMEDMCQLTERLTEDKYKGSHEQISGIIKKYSDNPGFDLTRYFDLILFCYLTGNADMHLKNFSLLKEQESGWKLANAYDLINTRLVMPANKDPEELALTLGGKKSNFNRAVFISFGRNIGLNQRQVANAISNLEAKLPAFKEIISRSFLNNEMKSKYLSILDQRSQVLF